MMKTITLAVTAMFSLAVLTMTAMSQSRTGDTTYEKKSYNYAEWAKGRFSEVVTVRNAGKIIYLGGVGAEDESSAQGGVMRHLGDFGAQCRYAWDKIKRLLEKHGATVENIDKVVLHDGRSRFLRSGQMPNGGVRGRDPTCRHRCRRECPRLARNAPRG